MVADNGILVILSNGIPVSATEDVIMDLTSTWVTIISDETDDQVVITVELSADNGVRAVNVGAANRCPWRSWLARVPLRTPVTIASINSLLESVEYRSDVHFYTDIANGVPRDDPYRCQ